MPGLSNYHGKSAYRRGKACKKVQQKGHCLFRCVTEDADICNAHGIDAFFPILRSVTTLEEALDTNNAYKNLAATAYQVFRLLFLIGNDTYEVIMMNTRLFHNKIFSAGAALFCCALWGISTPIVKMGYTYIDETHIPSLFLWIGLLFAVAGFLTLGIYSLVSRKLMLPKKKSLKVIGIVGMLQTVGQYALVYIGMPNTSAVKGAILKSTDVFFVALIASLLFKLEKLTVKKLISCIIGFAGIIVMNLDGLSLNINPLGDGLVTLGIVSFSFGVIFIKVFGQDEDPILLSSCQMTLGGVVLLLAGTVMGGSMDFVGMLPVFAGLCAIYAISYPLWTVLLKHNSASSITIYSFMTPVFGVIFSALLLNEAGGVAPLSLIIAMVLVCFGIILWGYEKKK